MALLLLVAWLLDQGDLLAAPAITLILLTWLVLLATWLVTWLLTDLGPAGVAAARRLGRAAWVGLGDQPEGRRVAEFVRRAGDRLQPLAPAWRWLGRRLAVTSEGLGRTLPAAFALAAVVGLVLLAGTIDSAGPVAQTDRRFVELAGDLRTPGFVAVMSGLSLVARTQGLLLITGLMVAGAVVARAWRGTALLVATSLLSSLSVTVLKLVVSRPRPPVGQLVESSNAWPSGHAAGSLSLALGVTLLLWAAGQRLWRTTAAIVVPLGLMTGYSRAYLTVHWLSDVAAGWLVSVAAAAIVLLVDRLVRDRLPTPWRGPAARRWPLLLATVLALAFAVVRWTTGLDRSFPAPPPVEVADVAGVDGAVAVLRDDPFSTTLIGRELEPATVLVIAHPEALERAVADAGWVTTRAPTVPRLVDAYRSGVTAGPSASSPVTPAFLQQQLQTFAIAMLERDDDEVVRHRARFWRLPLAVDGACPVWAATAALEDQLDRSWWTVVPTRHTAPLIDLARDRLVRSLQDTGALDRAAEPRLVVPTLGTTATGDPYVTDGLVHVLVDEGACGVG